MIGSPGHWSTGSWREGRVWIPTDLALHGVIAYRDLEQGDVFFERAIHPKLAHRSRSLF